MRTLWPDLSMLPELTPHQLAALQRATSGPIGALSGVPGTGKTYALAALVRAAADAYGMSSVLVAAPTGKAAVRITENLQRYQIPVEAATIHRTLGVTRGGYDGKGWGFQHGPGRPLPARFVFVDEGSMLDTKLASDLLAACTPGTHLLIVGDPHQLPPVGNGAPLRDMLRAGIPHGELTEIKRNSGAITTACAAIRESRRPIPPERVYLPSGANWLHLEAHRPAFQAMKIQQLLQTLPRKYDPIRDVQVLCAMNDAGEVSRKAMNTTLQAILNPQGESAGGQFRIGDKVICTSNTLLELHVVDDDVPNFARKAVSHEQSHECPPGEIREFVANGELGRVVGVAEDDDGKPRGLLAQMDSPRRTVVVPLSGKKSLAKGDNEHAGAACDFDLAYAITCHKSQGSQWPIVITVIDEAARSVCSREWYYTAFSRAETLLVTVGRLDVLHRQSKRSELAGRKTFLAERLSEVL